MCLDHDEGKKVKRELSQLINTYWKNKQRLELLISMISQIDTLILEHKDEFEAIQDAQAVKRELKDMIFPCVLNAEIKVKELGEGGLTLIGDFIFTQLLYAAFGALSLQEKVNALLHLPRAYYLPEEDEKNNKTSKRPQRGLFFL